MGDALIGRRPSNLVAFSSKKPPRVSAYHPLFTSEENFFAFGGIEGNHTFFMVIDANKEFHLPKMPCEGLAKESRALLDMSINYLQIQIKDSFI
ncbi:UNVERIFIED_CONTAM: hypothetical protein Slati_3693100 [Sesamum latifolium]|uniref:Uncharacterized protein n=1 Tax=Sesamum latifolium TaxID=2727402 RepID=A0AAW2U2H5_9LAMI